MDGRTELLAYLGTSIVTIAVLFGLQEWYASYLDVSVVHAQVEGINPQLEKVRHAEAQKLSSGAMPIEQAKRMIAQRGRTAFPKIAPKASDDLTPMSGWINQLGFHPYEPRAPQVVAQAEPPAAGTPDATENAAAKPAEAKP